MMRKWFVLLSVFTLLAAALGSNVTAVKAQATYVTYTVKQGDTLGKIAREYCTTWNEIYDLNRDTIGTNPNVIRPGMVLTVPSYCGNAVQLPEGTVVDKGPTTRATGLYVAPYYTVAWGDNLYSIGNRFGVAWQNIAKANGITGTNIYPGQVLFIPGGVANTNPPAGVGTIQRVNFQKGASSATLTGTIYQGTPTSYVLWARAGQTMVVNTVSHGEPLVISVGNTRGDLLPLTGINSQVNNSVVASLPESGDYIVTVRPATPPENPQLAFDITFTIK
jgi:LysM repeat protein